MITNRINTRNLFAAALALAISAHPFSVRAQSTATAQLAGQVLDLKGEAVQGATVRIIDTERNNVHLATTDKSGHYMLLNLEVAPYRLEVIKDGYAKLLQNSIVLHVGDNREINVTLKGGAHSEQSVVKEGANLVQTEQTSVSQIVSRKSILELPLNGRQPTQLVLISGASVVTPPGDMATSKNYPSSTTISIAGGQPSGTNYLLDGGTNTDTFTDVNLPIPFPDALQEFGVATNSLPARSGYLGGGVVTIVTKSGSNGFHGSLFEFVRNGVFNAQNRFSTVPDALKRNQFGGTFGGPILKNKLFFFGGYQDTRLVSQPGSTFAYVPTAAELAGDFTVQESATCQTHGAKTLTGYSNNRIPTSQFDKAALALIKYLPTTTDVCGKVHYGAKAVNYESQSIGRVDWNQNDKHNVFVRYFLAGFSNPAPFSATNLLVTTSPGLDEEVNAVTLGDGYTLRSNLLNSFHGTFTRRGETRGASTSMINPGTLGINVYAPIPNDLHVSVSNDFAIGCGTCGTARFGITTFEFADDMDYVKGKHHVGFGASVLRTDNNIVNAYDSNGLFSFNGNVTGDSMADYLLGALGGLSQSRNVVQALRETVWAPYIQDSVRLNRNLLLTAGLRWEPQVFAHDFLHRGASFSQANFDAGIHSAIYPAAPAGAVYAGDAGVPTNFTPSDLSNFSPRLGIVWDPTGKGRETLRAGASLVYDQGSVFALQRLQYDPPGVNQIDLTTSKPGGFSDPYVTGYSYAGGSPFPGTGAFFPTSGNWVYLPSKLRTTSTEQWNLTYQRQVGADWVFEASYLGNRTNHMWGGLEMDPAIYSTAVCAQFSTGCTTSNTTARRRLIQQNAAQGKYFGNVTLVDDRGNASYNGMLLSANHRLTKGISVLANYTWSHCISDMEANGDISTGVYSNPSNPGADKASCSFDIRHITNASVVQTVGPSGNSVLAKVVGQWQLAPLVRITSGIPLNVVTGTDQSRTGVGLDRPNYTGATPYSKVSELQYLDPSAFTANAVGTLGNVGRNALRGPGAFNFDLGLTRMFTVRRFEGQIRCDTFNVINKVNLIAPATGTGIPGISPSGINMQLSSAQFGQISSAGDPRIIQLAMKVAF